MTWTAWDCISRSWNKIWKNYLRKKLHWRTSSFFSKNKLSFVSMRASSSSASSINSNVICKLPSKLFYLKVGSNWIWRWNQPTQHRLWEDPLCPREKSHTMSRRWFWSIARRWKRIWMKLELFPTKKSRTWFSANWESLVTTSKKLRKNSNEQANHELVQINHQLKS